MRLSHIKLAGFKSFVDPSHLPLPSNLTSVVGPNGCGKSNIIDAVRWLLGESSMRTLRSESMEDVIFNGSKSRKPVGRASVELTFDNSDGSIQGPYASYNEIAVKRELTRDGGSQYYLNGAKCLKRDITDLFLGTGLGARSGYAIIEQGMVSRMIEAKPEELRVWLEEAAGISKYKERRRETESRIRQTRENLSRINDVRVELQARLDALRRQAANAEKYKTYKEQERRLRAEVLLLRLLAQEQLCAGQGARIAELEQVLHAARSGVQAAAGAREQADAGLRQAQQVLGLEQSRVYEAEAELARKEQSLNHARELRTLKTRELEQLDRQLAELGQRQAQDLERLQALRAALEQEQAALAAAAAAGEQAQSGLVAAEEAANAVQNRWEEFTQRAETPLYQSEGERVRVRELERALAQVQQRVDKLRGEAQALDPVPLQASLTETDRELEELDRDIRQGQERLAGLERELGQLRDQRAALEGALHEARQGLQSARGRLSSLETLQNAALRQDDADVVEWLRSAGLEQSPRLASVLQVDAGWEGAVEHVLGELLQAPVAGEAARLLDVPRPRAGGAVVAAANGNPGTAGTLAARVRGPAAATQWLTAVQTAGDIEEVRKLLAALPDGASVVTRDGAWYGHGWARYPRQDDGRSGVIARGLLLKQLRAQVDGQVSAVRDKEQALDTLRTRLAELDQERREIAGRFDQLRARQAQRLAHRQAQAVRLEQTQSRIEALAEETQALETACLQQGEELETARTQLAQLEAVAQQLHAERATLQQQLGDARRRLQEARDAVQQAQQARSRAEVAMAGTRSSLGALDQALAEQQARLQGLQQQRAQEEAAGRDLDAPIQAHAAEIEAARANVESTRQALRAARENSAAAEARVTEAAQRAHAAEADLDAARERLQQSRLEYQGADARRQSIAEQFEEAGLQRAELQADLPPDAGAEAWDEKLERLARRIERLGPINLAAIQELEEASAREAELGAQHTDITQALETLEEAIRKIDRETKERFRVTFDRVNEIFRERFPRLFGGGEGYLELTGEDLLDSGVRVMARPPGKRNSTIQQLSGGEKAMTAVALLLALFDLNPAPFCMLDEVDAPLDDANVARFVEVISDMSSRIQFIIITHNKITMELAEHLHGVTMQEPGVSRLVSVDVRQALDLAGEAA